MDSFRFSLTPQAEQAEQAEQAQEHRQFVVDSEPHFPEQLNQHVLLTVQAINQMQAVFTVRGA